jgi:hypothetical protein
LVSSKSVCAGVGALLFLVASGSTAAAQPPDPDLLVRISHHAQAFEDITKRASFTFDVVMEKLDGDGKVDETKKKHARIESDGKTEHQVVMSCTLDGKDTTTEEREKVRKQEAEAAKKRADKSDDDELHMPFLPAEQPKYVFDQVAVDPQDPGRVKISFVPREPTKHTVEGTAWVDTATGNVVSAGVKLSKPPTFVDWVHFTAEFGASTPLGPALSHITFEGKGGFLFIRKHFRGELTLGDYHLAPASTP